MAASVKRAVMDSLFDEDLDFADAVLSVVKPYRPRTTASTAASAAAAAPVAVATVASTAAAAVPAEVAAAEPVVSRKAIRDYMKRQLLAAGHDSTFSAASVLPGGQTCGAFLFDEWRARASKALKS